MTTIGCCSMRVIWISMDKKHKDDMTYLTIAEVIAQRSYDNKYKVGAIIEKHGQILSQGWNGTPSGCDNSTRDSGGNTLPTVVHAEANALVKLAKTTGNGDGATMYCTHSPCYNCSLLLYQMGVKRVVYRETYSEEAKEFLTSMGIAVEQIR